METTNELAINLMNLFTPNEYVEFNEGDFPNCPKISGAYYIFDKLKEPKICLIVNISKFKYPSDMIIIKDYLFIVVNAESLDEYFLNLGEKYFPTILEIIDQKMQKQNDRNLPYGYYTDENGDLRVDIKKAGEVRKIYNSYVEEQSVRKIANDMKTNFSFIRDILHDNERYAEMQPKILTNTVIQKVAELMAENIRGGATAKRTFKDELKEIRARNAKIAGNSAQAQAMRSQA